VSRLLGGYLEVLRLPGAAAFSAAGVLARLPISMLGIGIVLLVVEATGSYAVAGWVAAVFGIVQALAAPVVARAVDRLGQARVMRPAIAVHVLGLILLMACAQARAPRWMLFAAVAVMGATIGSLGTLVRARWSFLLTDHPRRPALMHRAYSLESVLDEVVFIVGPILVTLLATQTSPVAGLAAAACAVGTGGAWLLGQRGTEPPASRGHAAHPRGGMNLPGLAVLVLAFAGIGVVFGSVEVLTIAFTDERGTPGQAGAVLAAFAFGSMLAGVGYGAVQWRSAASRRLLIAVLLLAVGLAPALLAWSVLSLAGVVFVAGFAISPMLISGNALVQDLLPAGRLTEGLSWVSTGLGLGIAIGAATSGVAVDRLGAAHGFVVPVSAGVVSALVVLAGQRFLSPPRLAG
jgi:MFS family permease